MEKIKPPSPEMLAPYLAGKNLALLVGNVLICLMMVCVALGFYLVGTRLIPDWKGFYLVWLSLLVSLESIYSRKRIADFDQQEKIYFRIAEWVAFAVLIKIIIYLVNGPAQLLEDIPLWQENFLENFFTGEYILALFVSLLVWWSSAAHSAEIEELYVREKEANWDDLGKVQNALRDIRNRTSSRIFIVGTLLVGLAVISRLDTSLVFLNAITAERGAILPVVNVMLYFAIALVLLTQTQFVLLRARWIHQRLQVSPNLAKNWMKYGLIFFLLLVVIVIFLPTNYSLGLFETLKFALGYLLQAVMFLIALISLPIVFCLSLFSLTSKTTGSTPGGAIGAFPVTPAGQAPAWWDFIKSLAFWIIFIGIILFALRYYFMQNTALWKAIRNFPFFRWVSGVWNRLLGWLKGANQQVSGMFAAGLKRLRAQRANLPVVPLRKIFNLSRLSAREKIVYYYLSLIQLGGERGLERGSSQTPYNYQRLVSQAVPEVEEELHGLTETFLEARYSQHPVEEPNAAQAGSFWERIKTVLRNWQKPDGRN